MLTASERKIRRRKALLVGACATRGVAVRVDYDASVARFGVAAQDAIADYRHAAGLPPRAQGGWSRDLEAACKRDAPSSCPLAAGETLVRGAKGAEVFAWQQTLRALGWRVAADGVLGPKTVSATTVALLTAGVAVKDTARPVVDAAAWRAVWALRITPGRSLRDYVPLPPKIVDARNGRAGFPVNASKTWASRSVGTITTVIGHYTGGLGSFLADAHFHVESPYLSAGGAPAIAYGLGVDLDGTLYVFNEADQVTWHCDGGRNTDTVGLVFRGAEGGMTTAQQRTMRWLFAQAPAGALDRYGWPAAAFPLRLSTHRHVKATSCPGEVGEAQYAALARECGWAWTTNP